MDPAIKAVSKTIPPNCKNRTVLLGGAIFLVCVVIHTTLMYGTVRLAGAASLLCALLSGVSTAMLFIVGHDACHGSLTPSRRANRFIGTLAFLPSLHPFSSWAKTHNTMHHVWTNLKGRDPGYAPFTLDEFQRLSLLRRIGERIYRSPLGLALFYLIEVWWKFEIYPSRADRPRKIREFQFDRLLVFVFAVSQLALFCFLAARASQPHPILFGIYAVLIPFCVFNWLMGFVTFQHHTHPEIPWFDREEEWSFFQSQVAGTTHLEFPKIVEIVLLNILDHTAHHVDPTIPLYRLREGQAALETAFPQSMKVIRWTPAVFMTTLRCCKLYDYREHRWLDFQGKPSTPPIWKAIEP